MQHHGLYISADIEGTVGVTSKEHAQSVLGDVEGAEVKTALSFTSICTLSPQNSRVPRGSSWGRS